MRDEVVICRCEDLTLAELQRLIEEGHVTLAEIKRISRAGMGPCQGTTCAPLIARVLAASTGRGLGEIDPPSCRPPIGGIKLCELVRGKDED